MIFELISTLIPIILFVLGKRFMDIVCFENLSFKRILLGSILGSVSPVIWLFFPNGGGEDSEPTVQNSNSLDKILMLCLGLFICLLLRGIIQLGEKDDTSKKTTTRM